MVDDKITKSKKPEWLDEINMDSVKKSLDAGIILPKLSPVRDRVYTVKVLGNMSIFKTDYGKAIGIDVEHDSMDKNLVIAKSFKFQLTVQMERLGLIKDGYPDFNQLIGKTLIFQKSLGNTKTMKNVELYSVQIK